MPALSDLSVVAIVVLLLLGGVAVGVGVVRALAKGSEPAPPLIAIGDGHFELVGKPVVCLHCGERRFTSRQVLLNTWFMSLLRFDWLDTNATLLSCRHCGALRWFSQRVSDPPTKAGDEDRRRSKDNARRT